MKKMLALILSLMMMFSCIPAVAETTETVALYFDPAVQDIMPGQFIALDGLGLMFYLPDVMQEVEMTEEDIAGGGLAAYTDGTAMVSVAYAPIADDAGNPLCDVETIAEYYNSLGMTSYVRLINDVACVTFTVPETTLCGVVYADGQGGLLAFSFSALTDAANVMISSIMPYAAE